MNFPATVGQESPVNYPSSPGEDLRRYFLSADRAQQSVGLSSLGTPVLVLLALASSLYLGYLIFAIAVQRHLFGDASWFLIKMLIENHVAIWNPDGWRDIYVGRFGAFAYQEYPTILASRLGVHSLRALSTIYGITLFSFKPLSIVLCYRFARDKRLIFFPLLTLFAVTINSEAYIVSETHLMTALFWPALFALLYCREIKGFDLLAMVVVSAPLLLCYESMAAYGSILCFACVYRLIAVARTPLQKWLTVLFGLWYLLGTIFAVLAIMNPRDLSNREGFLNSLLFMVHNDHIGARVSCIVMVLCAVVLLVPNAYRTLQNLLVGASVVCSLAIPIYIRAFPGRTSLDVHIVARTMNATVPLALALGFLLVHFGWLKVDTAKYRRLFVMVTVLGICQSGWHVLATRKWMNMLNVMRVQLRSNQGAVAFEDTPLGQWTVNGRPIRALHADWPLMPMSILFADHGRVQTILIPQAGEFEPFNPSSAATLPPLAAYGIDYAPYLAALSKGPAPYQLNQWISFNASPEAAGARRIGDWWSPEPWGTWTGKNAALAINLPDPGKASLRLEVRAGAFVNPKNPEIDVEVLINDVSAGVWNFRYQPGASPWNDYTAVFPQEALAKSETSVIRFRVTGARSPDELGMAKDPRLLGLALVRLRLVEAH